MSGGKLMTENTEAQQHPPGALRRLPFWLIIGILAILASNAWLLVGEQRSALRQSDLASRNLVDSIAYKTQATMEKIDMLASRLASEFSHFPKQGSNTALREELAEIVAQNPDIAMVVLINMDGHVTASHLKSPPADLNLKDRDYFRYHLRHPGEGLLIGKPIKSRLDGNTIIPVSRRVNDARGRMIGVIFIPLAVQPILAEFARYDIGEHGFIGLAANGHVLVRHPFNGQASGMNLSQSAQFVQHYDQREAGQFIEYSPLDGEQRRYSFRRVPKYPMVVAAGISERDLMSDWLPSALAKFGYGLALSAALVFIAFNARRRLVDISRSEHSARSALAAVEGYRQALDDHVVTARVDQQGRVIDVNDKFSALSGFRRDELLDRQLPFLDGRVSDPEFAAVMRQTLRTGVPWRGTRCAVSKHGDVYWLESCIVPVAADGEQPHEFLLAQTDVTRLKMASERQEKINRQLTSTLALNNAILDSTECGIIATDASGTIVLFNAAAKRLLGYEREQARQMSVLDFHLRSEIDALFAGAREDDRLLPRDFGTLVDAIRDADRSEWTYRRRDRSLMPVSLTFTTLGAPDSIPHEAQPDSRPDARWEAAPNSQGTTEGQDMPDQRAHGYVIVFNDLTTIKQLSQMKSDFVSVVSHELRTPLTSIKGSLALLQARTATGDAAQSKLFGIASDNCDKLVRLVSDILDLDKMQRRQMSFELSPQLLQPLVEKALTMTQPYADQFGVRYQLQADGGAVLPAQLRVNVDADRFLQVMSNLLSNAAKFSHPGGEVEVMIQVDDTRSHWLVSVRDRGEGIPDEFQPHVFDKFTQSRSALTRTRAGTGLGLSIAKAIVDAHDGSIDFHSVAGLGTTFHVRLPVCDTCLAD